MNFYTPNIVSGLGGIGSSDSPGSQQQQQHQATVAAAAALASLRQDSVPLEAPTPAKKTKGSKGGALASSSKSASNPLISPTEKCKVCGEPAAKHIHYGAVTCFSCRAFFRRSIQNTSTKTYTCRKSGQCDISLKTRKNCQKCRYDRCLAVGMKPSWVLSEEERFRRFRKHREKQHQGGTSQSSREEDRGGRGSLQQSSRVSRESEDSSGSSEPMDLTSHMDFGGGSPPPPTLSQPLEHLPPPPMDTSPYPLSMPLGHTYTPPGSFVAPPTHPPHVRQMPPHPTYHLAGDPALFGGMAVAGAAQPMEFTLPSGSGLPYAVGSDGRLQQYDEGRLPPGYPQAHHREWHSDNDSQISTSDEGHHRRNSEMSDEDGVTRPLPPLEPIVEISEDEISQIRAIAQVHDVNYKSVNFGEELIKEMILSSACGIPLSPKSTMTAYRLMIQRVHRVATGFSPFENLPHAAQSALLKHNADLVVSLRGAVFFETKKKGFDQILISLGIDDLAAAKNMIMSAMKTQTCMNKIAYSNMNALQKIEEESESEKRYNVLLERVGSSVTFNNDLVKLLSYVLLFMGDFSDPAVVNRPHIEATQETMINMMQRYIFSQYPRPMAVQLFARMLACIADLQELTWIKKQRQLIGASSIIEEKEELLTDANKPKRVAAP